MAFPANWSSVAPLVILSIETNQGKPLKQILWSMFYVGIYALVYALAIDLVYGLIQLGFLLVLTPLAFYNGRKSENATLNKVMKWFFYAYYPLHLLVLGTLELL